MHTQSHLLRNQVLWKNCKVTQTGETLENYQFTFDLIHLKLKVMFSKVYIHGHYTCTPDLPTTNTDFPGPEAPFLWVFQQFPGFKANRKCFDMQSHVNLPFLFIHVQVGSEYHKLVFLGLPTFVYGYFMRPVCTKIWIMQQFLGHSDQSQQSGIIPWNPGWLVGIVHIHCTCKDFSPV